MNIPSIVYVSYPHSNKNQKDVYGWSEYSYRYLAEAVIAAFQNFGFQIEVVHTEENLNYKIKKNNASGIQLHIAIGPPNCTFFSALCKNFIIFAWEFPDIPDYKINGDLRNNWIKQLQFYDEIYTLSDFATSAIRAHFPSNSFTLPVIFLSCAENLTSKASSGGAIQILSISQKTSNSPMENVLELLGHGKLRMFYRNYIKVVIPSFIHGQLVFLSRIPLKLKTFLKSSNPVLPSIKAQSIEQFTKDYTIFSSWLNPFDERKNFVMLLDSAAHAISLNPQLKLMLKLHCSEESGLNSVTDSVLAVVKKYKIDPSSIGFVFKYLNQNESQLFRTHTSIYLNTSSGEGLCWPVLEHLACGIPAIVPENTVFLKFSNVDAILKYECDMLPSKFPFNKDSSFDTYSFPPIRKSLHEAICVGSKLSKSKGEQVQRYHDIKQFLDLTLMGGVLFEIDQ